MAFSAMSASESFSTRFPLKLWRLLNRCNTGAISWAEHGRSIKIDRRRFEREYLMPVDSAFKTSNFSSFVRQLNLYGFRKVINTFRFPQTGDAFGDADIHEYHHPFFRRGHPDLLNRVQRRMKGRKSASGRHELENDSSSLVASLLKPVNQSTSQQHTRYDRPPLHVMDVNGTVVRYPAIQLDSPTFTAGCQGIVKLLPGGGLQEPGLAGTAAEINPTLAPRMFIPTGTRPRSPPRLNISNYRIQPAQSQPKIHPGLQVVEAIQQVLGEKALSDMVLQPSMNNAPRCPSQGTPLLPVLNALCSSPASSEGSSHIPPITTDSFLSNSLTAQSAFPPKPPGGEKPLPFFHSAGSAPLSTNCHQLTVDSSVLGAGELSPQMSLIPEPVIPHVFSILSSAQSNVQSGSSSTLFTVQAVPVSSTGDNNSSNNSGTSNSLDCLQSSASFSASETVVSSTASSESLPSPVPSNVEVGIQQGNFEELPQSRSDQTYNSSLLGNSEVLTMGSVTLPGSVEMNTERSQVLHRTQAVIKTSMDRSSIPTGSSSSTMNFPVKIQFPVASSSREIPKLPASEMGQLSPGCVNRV